MAKEVFYKARDAIKCGKPEVLEFSHLTSADCEEVIKDLFHPANRLEEHRFRLHFSPPDHYLRVVIPSYLHEAAGSWLVEQYSEWRVDGLINATAARSIIMPVSPRVTNFVEGYAGSIKEPDFSFVPLGAGGMRRDFPSVVLEAGWTSTEAGLVRDRCHWHEGSGGEVMVVILVKLFRPRTGDQVRVTLQVSHVAPNTGVKITRRDIFPIPEHPEPDPTLTIVELFGGQCPPNHPSTILPLGLNSLRRVVEANLRSDGYRPAELRGGSTGCI
ncbi:hypothetical protein HOY82DRAFT_589391 [Tuber indicum]|nr:hypothetical protein HOY82DRAFT_589391 [Tuber indicum]